MVGLGVGNRVNNEAGLLANRDLLERFGASLVLAGYSLTPSTTTPALEAKAASLTEARTASTASAIGTDE